MVPVDPVTVSQLSRGARQAGRIQSPSSILTYKQCPRKYYYRYIARLPSGTSIHLIRGSIAHKVMEGIYDVDLNHIPDTAFLPTLRVVLQEKLRREWENASADLASLGLSDGDLGAYYDETRVMVNNFYHWLVDRMRDLHPSDLKEAFRMAKPLREVELLSERHGVRGYADAIHRENGKVVILDYKTSNKAEITPEYRLQLSIYGMLYEERERLPDEVGILFLKFGTEQRLPVTQSMVATAKLEVADVREKTTSVRIDDYPKREGPLCKWSTGQCDYYGHCFPLVQIGKR